LQHTIFKALAVSAYALAIGAGAASAQERMGAIPPEKMTDAQKRAVSEMKGPFPVGGPFAVLLRDPKLDLQAYATATYFRNESVLGVKITEMVILMIARGWTQQFEWNAHVPRALQNGLKQDIIAAIADGRRPQGMAEDEEIAYDFITELDHNKSVSDATYARAVKKFGEQGVVNLTVLDGYYQTLAMILNVARTPGGEAQKPALQALPR
jgi:4-carboxymuconolactone decarboxylase